MIEQLILFVIYIIVLGLVVYLLQWILGQIPMADPFKRVANIAIVVIACLILILLLLQLVGMAPPLGRIR